jgi:hypothetical protein
MIKSLFIFLIFCITLFANSKKVYYYTTENNINDFKSLKIGFDKYLQEFGDYEFQAFSDKKIFEKFIKQDESLVILSSWHYDQISSQYNLKAKLVAKKKESITDTKVLIGKKDTKLSGTVTTAYTKEYTNNSLSKLINTKKMDFLVVPKEIDALMSVGFGMSSFAYVSKDSFELLKKVNSFLANSLVVHKESVPTLRMIVASKYKQNYDEKLKNIFENMEKSVKGKKLLSIFKIDGFVILSKNSLEKLNKTKEENNR